MLTYLNNESKISKTFNDSRLVSSLRASPALHEKTTMKSKTGMTIEINIDTSQLQIKNHKSWITLT